MVPHVALWLCCFLLPTRWLTAAAHRVGIVGASGYVGSALHLELEADENFEVTGWDIAPSIAAKDSSDGVHARPQSVSSFRASSPTEVLLRRRPTQRSAVQ